jgi:TorA maturation chaperone TorD/NAD-dependent dihydropyrimidine dehydrogenase PreA subunit
MEKQARIRSQLYAALAQGFRRPTPTLFAGDDEGPPLARVMRGARAEIAASPLNKPLDTAVGFLENQAAEEAIRTLEIEYNRLFVGPAQPQALPYESVYRDPQGLVMGTAAQDVLRRYAAEGLTLSPSYHDLPDHVAVELEFMAHLARCEAQAWKHDDVEGALAYLGKEDAFLRDHLSKWVSAFCERIWEGTEHSFYTVLAKLTEAFVALDAQQISTALQRESALAEGTRAGWEITLDVERCSLCGVCVQACPSGALALAESEEAVALTFIASHCDGCGICQRRCPESAITALTLVGEAVNAEEQTLFQSPRALCTACGGSFSSQANLQRIRVRVGEESVAAHRLSLCPSCKAVEKK